MKSSILRWVLFSFAATVASFSSLALSQPDHYGPAQRDTRVSEPIPAQVVDAIRTFRVQKFSLQSGVLRVVMDMPVVTPDLLRSVTTLGVCGEHWREPEKKLLASMKLTRVEVLNFAEGQGLAFQGGQVECEAIGRMNGADSDSYLSARTVRCEAGVCRRRP